MPKFQKSTSKIFISLLRIFLSLSGLLLLYSVDWRILIGVFLFLWGNNIDLISKFEKKRRNPNHD